MTDPQGLVHALLLRRPYAFQSPFGDQEFVALVLAASPDVTSEETAKLAEALVAQGCRYAVCGGPGCSAWEDAIDEAAVMAEVQGTARYGLVVTTSHEGESVDDVVTFFLGHADIDDAQPLHRIAIVVGDAGEQFDNLKGALRKAGAAQQ